MNKLIISILLIVGVIFVYKAGYWIGFNRAIIQADLAPRELVNEDRSDSYTNFMLKNCLSENRILKGK